jgi:ATP-dependent Clp protease ATP-binding subunit ClpC
LIPDRSLPDKAIDVLENAASFVKITSLSFSNALPTKARPTVKREQIERMLEDQYGIKIHHDAALQPAKVADVLGAELVGQQAAVAQLVESLSSLSVGKSDESRPLGVFLFAGPTGVGKTFAAECVARALFGTGEKRIGRFNMNEYKERHDLARMIGAPPGFIGHDQQGALFRFLEANTGGLILFDEMEKAHPEIQDYFLQIFDQGRARDARGRWVDFRNQLFILTCNFAGDSGRERQIGFVPETDDSPQVSSKELDHLLARSFRPEFLARIDRVIAFRSLSLENYQQLFDGRLAELKQEVSAHYGAVVEVAADVQRELCERAEEQSEGVRGFAKEFERTLMAPLIEFIKAGSQGATVRVSIAEGRLVFQ